MSAWHLNNGGALITVFTVFKFWEIFYNSSTKKSYNVK